VSHDKTTNKQVEQQEYYESDDYGTSINRVAPKPVRRIHASKFDIFEFCNRIKNYDPVYDGEDKDAFINNMVCAYNTRFIEDFRKYVTD
jgi:hypothetical protein